MKEHKKSHDITELITCNDCNKTFSSIKSLERHKKSKHAPVIVQSEKGVLFYDYSTRTSNETVEFHCSICKQDFVQKYNLNRHNLSKHGHPEPESNVISFKDHYFKIDEEVPLNNNHKTNINHYCKLCNEEFKNATQLHSHIRSKHMRKKCPKTFKQNVYLNRHIKVFHKKNNVACKYCSKVFTRRQNLKIHIMS